jgi:hypothetical protein
MVEPPANLNAHTTVASVLNVLSKRCTPVLIPVIDSVTTICLKDRESNKPPIVGYTNHYRGMQTRRLRTTSASQRHELVMNVTIFALTMHSGHLYILEAKNRR